MRNLNTVFSAVGLVFAVLSITCDYSIFLMAAGLVFTVSAFIRLKSKRAKTTQIVITVVFALIFGTAPLTYLLSQTSEFLSAYCGNEAAYNIPFSVIGILADITCIILIIHSIIKSDFNAFTALNRFIYSATHCLLGIFLYGYFNYLIYSAIYDNNASATHEMFVWHDFFTVLGLFTVSLGAVSLLLQVKKLLIRQTNNPLSFIPRLILKLNGGFLFIPLRIFMIEKIQMSKNAHFKFDIIAYLTTETASYRYKRRFYLRTIDGI